MRTLSRREDLVQIRDRIGGLALTDERHWGTMTVQQMVCHVHDAFLYPLGVLRVNPMKGPRIPVRWFKWLALSAPMKWPKGFPAPPEVDQNLGGTRPGEFEADLAALLLRLDQFAATLGPFPPHPLFGPMSRAEWMRWGYLHTDHHLRQFGR